MALFRKRYEKLSDERLMVLVQQGDPQAFDELYHRYSTRLLRYFYRMLGGDELKAQDFLQESFLKILNNPDYYDSSRKFSTWIYTIAHNLCKNEYRRMSVRKVLENGDQLDNLPIISNEEIISPTENLDKKNFLNQLMGELNKLELSHKNTFLLRFQENLTIKEIAELMDCKEGTVKSRLFYITKKLAKNLKDYNPFSDEVKNYE
jgi:RNA polymerase sigma-70 factor (ECF subfamily)